MSSYRFRLAPKRQALVRNNSRSTKLEVILNPTKATFTPDVLEPGEELFVFGDDGRYGLLIARWLDAVAPMPAPYVMGLESL